MKGNTNSYYYNQYIKSSRLRFQNIQYTSNHASTAIDGEEDFKLDILTPDDID
jgi:hypothetical protein